MLEVTKKGGKVCLSPKVLLLTQPHISEQLLFTGCLSPYPAPAYPCNRGKPGPPPSMGPLGALFSIHLALPTS